MICNEWINACNATLNFGYMNGHSSRLPRLNCGCKIECLHLYKGKIYLGTRNALKAAILQQVHNNPLGGH